MPRKKIHDEPGRPAHPERRRDSFVVFVYPRTEAVIRAAAAQWGHQPGAFLDAVVDLLTGIESEPLRKSTDQAS
jgi:hypothetical protein